MPLIIFDDDDVDTNIDDNYDSVIDANKQKIHIGCVTINPGGTYYVHGTLAVL